MTTRADKMPRIERPPVDTAQVEFAQRGHITIPKKMRDRYSIIAGQRGAVIDLGGAFLVTTKPSRIADLCDELRAGLGTADMSLEEMLQEMRRIRETTDDQA